MIKTVEIICLPCKKCEAMKSAIFLAIKTLERKYQIKIRYEFKVTPNLKNISKYSVNASQAPILLINDQVELSGPVKPEMVAAKLDSIHRVA